MKKLLFIVSIVSLSTVYAAKQQESDKREVLIKQYKHMFESIGKKRIGASYSAIKAVKPPFLSLQSKKKKSNTKQVKSGTKVAQTPVYELQAIVNNRVKISGKWYQLNDKVNGFTLITIDGNNVVLQNNKYKKRLTLRKENAKISIK